MFLYILLLPILCIHSTGVFDVWDGKDIYDDPTSQGNSSSRMGISSGNVGGGNKKLQYLNGRIMTGKVRVNFVFYGKDWTNEAIYKLQHLIQHLDQTPYFDILKSYKDRSGASVSGPMVVDKTVMLSNIYGNQITDDDVFQLIRRAFPHNDVSAQYVFISDSNTQVSLQKLKSCEHFCGYHRARGNYKYSFVGDGAGCPKRKCAPSSDSPNADLKVDATSTTLIHEVFETITDPFLDAYIDEDGYENADKCNFIYGVNTGVDKRGQGYNVVVGNLKYKIQKMWSIVKDSCVMRD